MFFSRKNKTPNYSQTDNPILQLGSEILSGKAESKSLFNKDWWYGKIMDLSMKSPSFKTQMFRFVDVLPYLNDNEDVAKHLKEYFSEDGSQMPSVFQMGANLGAMAPGLLANSVRKNVTEMAKLFITGETPEEALPKLEAGRKKNLAFTVDLLGEATLSEKEAADYQRRYMELIEALAEKSVSWSHNPQLDSNHLGEIPKVNVSVKLSSLYSQVHVTAWEETQKILIERIKPIFDLAVKKNIFINVDMEHYAIKDLTLEVFKKLLMLPEYKSYPHFGIVLQAYLRDSYQDAQALVDFAKHRGTPFSVRLVKGAYWDSEVIHAKQSTWPVPVYTQKQESDANYEKCCDLFLKNNAYVHVAVASHNVRSIAYAIQRAQELGLPNNAFELQMLYGMADNFKAALIAKGYRLREYATVGEMIPGMAYLVRRLLENTSNESFLRTSSEQTLPLDVLLKDPKMDLPETSSDPGLTGFINEPLVDFSKTEQRKAFVKTLETVKSQLPMNDIPYSVAGKEKRSGQKLERYSPNETQLKVCDFHYPSPEDVSEAIASAQKTFATWRYVPYQTRSTAIHKLADLIAKHRHEIAALQVFEVGKSWEQADGDLTEAIDFCRYYAEDIKRLGAGEKVGSVPGETSIYHYIPKGVVGVIAPWNFPFAILTGMVAAALVTGNTVLIKPAEQSTATAYWLYKLLKQIPEIPAEAYHFLPGPGENIGAQIVKDPDVNMIAFTGSKSVGLSILEQAGQVKPGQQKVKTAVIEMGGKNSIIIDSDADLDEAVAGVLYSAFGFQGQKCSACSRVIVLPQNYDLFVERLIEATSSIEIRNAQDPKCYVGPVVDEDSYKRLLGVIERAKSTEATLAYSATELPTNGYYVPPTIFTNVDPKSFLAQEEFFGPVLAVIKAKDLDDAIRIANGTEYALTSGIYSRSPSSIEKAKMTLEAGNIYINRSITGAMVNRHPFGGFKMSGLGSKTGGPDYLKGFMYPKVTTENTMRRGFSPDLVN
ncbi:MAG: proline dehydrogenase family protein [Bdellovibrionaceae bacterium]|nr:proline dehydrogenase family protein [Pseudobdellovibrionaceae bacterium]